MLWFLTLIAVLIASYLFWMVRSVKGSMRSPPGPTPLPYIGNLLYIARQHPVNYIALDKISKKYGDIVSLKVGPGPNILLSTSECVKDIYSRADCLNRPVNGTLAERNLYQNIGLAFSNDDVWNEIRKFSSRTLRQYGFGNRNAMEQLVKAELQNFTTFLKGSVDQSPDNVFCMDKIFHTSFLNLMSSMVSGKVHSYDDRRLKDLTKASCDWFEVPLLGVLTTMAFPWTRYVFPNALGYTKQLTALRQMHQYARNLLEEHRQERKFLEETKCFTDSYLKMAHEQEGNTTSLFTDDQFAVLCVDLLQGGADTTSNWMSFAILLLTLHPEVQEKVYKEMLDIIGVDREPASQDRDKMIYTQAVIYEIHRFARLTVIAPPRCITQDFEYRNFLFKKGTTILANLHSCFMDEDVWGDPETFRPERFLDDSGTLVNTDRMSINFGAGRRVCFGEALARESSFLYMTTLLQIFSFQKPPPNYPQPEFEIQVGIILRPIPYYVQFIRR